MTSLLPYIGGKHLLAATIAEHLRAAGREVLVEVFGGSAAVMLNAGFAKRVYNDKSEALATFFRVLRDDHLRPRMLRYLRFTPPSRSLFDEDYAAYARSGFSFRHETDPAVRAAKVLYRHLWTFGGKTRDGGWQVSIGNRRMVKEVLRYLSVLRRLSSAAAFFRATVIECLDYSACISLYGQRPDTVLYVDPPYVGTERYYPTPFSGADHVFLAHQLSECRAPVVVSYYDVPLIRDLYPESRWLYHTVTARKTASSELTAAAATTPS